MVLRPVYLVVVAVCLNCPSGCSTPAVKLKINTHPTGLAVYFSRRGVRAYEGSLGPVKGDTRAEPIVEDFVFLGSAPVEYTSLLQERESGTTVSGMGVTVVRRYADEVVRVRKKGQKTTRSSSANSLSKRGTCGST